MVTIEQIKIAEIFTGLGDAELQKIIPVCHEETLPKGTVIWKEGDSADRIYILQKGKARINLRGKSIIDIADPGKILGWSAFVKYNKYYTATAECLEDSTFIRITALDIMSLFRENQSIGLKVMDNLADVIARRLENIVEHY
jgi:CRP-like cAMP-binding protein